MARLLYVATTRARHTLVLALDEEIFARSSGEIQNGAQLKILLGDKQANRPRFEQLGVTPTSCEQTRRAGQLKASQPEASASPLRPLSPEELKHARSRADRFVR